MPARDRKKLAGLLGKLAQKVGGEAAPAMFFEENHARRGARRARA
jgi:hypothetical protein